LEVIVLLSLAFLLWMVWQLIKAKRFTQFKKRINDELKPQVINAIKNDLIANRNAEHPNNDAHIEASIFYWTQHSIRILQAALKYEVIDQSWLQDTGNLRNSQHLSHIEKQYKALKTPSS
jgi:hypothetical protein